MGAQVSGMWDTQIWVLREVVAIFLIVFLASPIHRLSDMFWEAIKRRLSVHVPRQQRVEVYVLLVLLQLCFIAVYAIIIFMT